MTHYYKIIQDHYITIIGTGDNEEQIAEEEYNTILDVIKHKPTPPEGYDYRLKEDLTWEIYELPPMPPEDPEATPEDLENALADLGVKEANDEEANP